MNTDTDTDTTPRLTPAGAARVEKNLIHWDQITLDRMKLTLPAELQEPFVWLGAFIRDECAKDLSVFEELARSLGFEHDRTTYAKILRGQFKVDADGNEREHPVLAAPKLLRLVEAVQGHHRRRELAGKVPFIMTTVAEDIFALIETKRSPDRVNKFGVIVGETGSQKTATLKEYARRNNHGTCVWVESPENGSLTELLSRLAERYGQSGQLSTTRKREKIFASVNSTRCIILDNVQNLYRAAHGHDQPAFDFLRRLQDERGCSVIMSLTPTFERMLIEGSMKGYFEQFVGRSGGTENWLRLPAYPPEEDVLLIAQAFKVRDAERHQDELVKISRQPGRVRRLFEDLQSAKLLAQKRGLPLTMSFIRQARGEN